MTLIRTVRPEYNAYGIVQLRHLPQLRHFSEQELFEMEVVAHVLPFKTNNFVVEELIDWSAVPNDPVFRMNFPHRSLLTPDHFHRMVSVLKESPSHEQVEQTANSIRRELNPHSDGQKENIPHREGKPLQGFQHKYRETLLVFPSEGQTCHAHCMFCFRWPQFVNMGDMKFSTRDPDAVVLYLRDHPEITDVLITGGDPLIMSTTKLARYVQRLLEPTLSPLKTIRIGTKSLSYWPYRFLTDPDAQALLDLFKAVVNSGKHLALMAHFNHPNELKPAAVQEAIWKIRQTGAEIRSQSPLLTGINDDAHVWKELWQRQISLGCLPYYMFLARDTGAQHYFGVPLNKALEIFQETCRGLSGLGRNVRGPVMSTTAGKVQILDIAEMGGEKFFVLQWVQARNPEWGMRVFFAPYEERALWLSDLKPSLGGEMS